MGSFSDYWENEILDHLFGKGNYASPTIYAGLSTTDPGDDGTGVSEPSGNGYARVATSAADWNAASGGSLDNAGTIAFADATGQWGTVTHFVLFDAVTGGNVLARGALAFSKTVSNGDTVRFVVGDLDVAIN